MLKATGWRPPSMFSNLLPASYVMTEILWVGFLMASFFIQSSALGQSLRDGEDVRRPRLTRLPAGVGTRCFLSGHWGTVSLTVANPSDQPVEVLASIHFPGQPLRQYARRVWIPAQAQRRVWAPIRVAEFPPDVSQVQIKTALLQQSDGRDEVLQTSTGEMFHTSLINIDHGAATGLIDDLEKPNLGELTLEHGVIEPDLAEYLHESIPALRGSMKYTLKHFELRDVDLPPQPEHLAALKHLVLATDRVTEDSAGLIALRRWLHRGGRLWILLDRVSPETVESLLGDDTPYQVIDRVSLNQARIVRSGAPEREHLTPEFEQPLEMVRVLTTDAAVLHRIDDADQGWPASFWKPIGKGRVVFSTLDIRAWIRGRGPRDRQPTYKSQYAKFIAEDVLWELGAVLNGHDPSMEMEETAQNEYLADRVGYEIVGRRPVAAALSVFCVLLLGCGWWLQRVNRLDFFWWLAPAAAVGTAAVIALMGVSSRRTAQPAAVSLQRVRAAVGSEEIHVEGKLALYHRTRSTTALGAKQGGVFTPDMSGLEGAPRRMVFTDFEQWQWQNLQLPAGVRIAPFALSRPTKQPFTARARFGPEGLTGTTATGDFQNLSDGVIALPNGRRVQARFTSESAFTAGPKDTLIGDTFLQQGLLGDEQRRRQVLYRAMFNNANAATAPARATLFVFADPLKMGFTFDPHVQRRGAALLELPLHIEPTAPGTHVVVPGPFVEFFSVAGPGQRFATSAYNRRKGEWVTLRTGSKMWFRFQFPSQVSPLMLESARLVLQIEAPSRVLTLSRLENGKGVELARRTNPSGQLEFVLRDRKALQLTDEGDLMLGLTVGDAEAALEDPYSAFEWRMERMWLEVQGSVGDR